MVYVMPRRTLAIALLTLVLLAIVAGVAGAQGEPANLTIGLLRTFGYGGFNEIQGNFRLTARGPNDLTRVVFYLDSQIMADDTQAPFQLDFVTDAYPAGVRSLRAVGYTLSGLELTSNTITTRFLSASQAQGQTVKLVVGLLGAILGVMGLSAAITNYLSRGSKRPAGAAGMTRSYGLMGAVVCPRCGKPSARLWYAPNLVAGKLQRCPHCGGWSIVRRASAGELARAESLLEPETQQVTGPGPVASAEDRLRADLENSRFEDPRH